MITAVPQSRLAAILETTSPRLRPILTMIRDGGINLYAIPPGGDEFDPSTDKPAIVLIDDTIEPRGPNAFHRKSLRRFVERCRSAVIGACEPLPGAYAVAAVSAAVLRLNVVIVETMPEYQAAWTAALDAINPDLALLLCIVGPTGGVQ